MIDDSIPLKRCNRCRKFLPSTSEFFVHDRSKKDGWHTLCRSCKKTPVERPPEGYKRCTTCRQIKPLTDFFRKTAASDQQTSQCKECVLKHQKEQYDAKHGIVPLPPVPEGFKRCIVCKEVRPATSKFFHRAKGELRGTCKACRSADRQTNPGKYKLAYRNRTEKQKECQKQRGQAHSRRLKDQRHVRRKLALAGHENEKFCPKCKQWYPATTAFFYPHKRKNKNGLTSHCKACQVINRVARKPGMKAWRQANKERDRMYNHTRRARKNAVQGTYTLAQIQEQLKRQHYCCYYARCGFAKFPKVNGKYVYEIEHTFPLSRVTGTDIPANDMSYLVLSCRSCNDSKGTKFPWEWPEGGRLM